jgi:hypothetical protein
MYIHSMEHWNTCSRAERRSDEPEESESLRMKNSRIS